MTIEIRIRTQIGDMSVDKEARVTYDDDENCLVAASCEQKETIEQRIQEIIRGLKSQPE